MWSDFAGHVDLLRLPRRTAFSASAVEIWATCRRAPVNCCASCTSRFHDGGLGRRLHAAQAQANEVGPSFMEQRSGHARIFRMLNHGKIDLGRQPQRVAHHRVVENGLAIVGDGTAPARCRPRKSVSTAPLLAWVAAAMGKTLTYGAALGTPGSTLPIPHRCRDPRQQGSRAHGLPRPATCWSSGRHRRWQAHSHDTVMRDTLRLFFPRSIFP